MATTQYFEKVLRDQASQTEPITFAFGRMNATGKNLLYFQIDGKFTLIDEVTGREICDKMASVSTYLSYDK